MTKIINIDDSMNKNGKMFLINLSIVPLVTDGCSRDERDQRWLPSRKFYSSFIIFIFLSLIK